MVAPTVQSSDVAVFSATDRSRFEASYGTWLAGICQVYESILSDADGLDDRIIDGQVRE